MLILKMEALYITSAQYESPLSVLLTFNDNHTALVNIGEFIQKHPHPQYNKYLEEKHFKKFKLENGNIVWGKNWDLIFPIDLLYKGTCE